MPIYISTHGIDRLYNENLNLSASILGKVVKVGKGAELKVVEDNIRIGDVDIKCISTPGHSDCSTTYVVGDYAIVGDVIFENAIGRYDLFDGDYGKLFNSIKVIKRLNVKRYFPGHGDSFEK
jgi:glyoxylase-like metal-dependent hydrolase (beta-lactamase superfamily II)